MTPLIVHCLSFSLGLGIVLIVCEVLCVGLVLRSGRLLNISFRDRFELRRCRGHRFEFGLCFKVSLSLVVLFSLCLVESLWFLGLVDCFILVVGLLRSVVLFAVLFLTIEFALAFLYIVVCQCIRSKEDDEQEDLGESTNHGDYGLGVWWEGGEKGDTER